MKILNNFGKKIEEKRGVSHISIVFSFNTILKKKKKTFIFVQLGEILL